MNLGQAITMQAVAGETVKRNEFLKRQICDILVRFGFAGPRWPALIGRFCWKIDVFGARVLAAVSRSA
jgi:hypothetical protein